MICPHCSGRGIRLVSWWPPRFQWCAECDGWGDTGRYAIAPRDWADWWYGHTRIVRRDRKPRASCLAALGLLVVACGTPAANFPTNTDDMTCGISETHCTSVVNGQRVRNGFCCPQATECGDPQVAWWCPSDSCCATGQGDGVGEFGAKAPVKQRREVR